MRVLTFTTQKGGSGKTTLATSIAVAAAQDGERVIALDTDPQGSLLAWGKRRGEFDNLLVEAVEPAALSAAIRNARANGGASLIIIDTPGVHGLDLRPGLDSADFVLIPIRPSIFDVEAVRPTVKLLRTLKKPFGFVLSQVNVTSVARNLDVAAALVGDDGQSLPMIGTRSDFVDSATAGQGVTEFAPKGRSAAEIRLLWHYVKTQLSEVSP